MKVGARTRSWHPSTCPWSVDAQPEPHESCPYSLLRYLQASLIVLVLAVACAASIDGAVSPLRLRDLHACTL